MLTDWQRNAETFCPDRRRREGDAAADAANEFRRDGIKRLGKIDQVDVDHIANALGPQAHDVFSVNGLQFYELDQILAVPQLKQIAQHEAVLREAAMHIGAVPKILDVSAWISTVPVTTDVDPAQRWHRDLDDWRACKLFVYLTDVGPENGPHQFVPGSHRPEYFERRGLVPDKFFIGAGRNVEGVPEIVDQLPRLEICAKAGTMFLANTYCFHKGKVPTAGRRVLFQVMYGLMDLENQMTGSKIPAIRKAWG